MHNPLKQKGSHGFTLFEMLISSAIFVIALGIVYGIYVSGFDIWEAGSCQTDLQAQARIALNYMASELRNTTRTSTQNPSPNLSIPFTPDNTSLTFYLPEDKDSDGLITDSDGEIEWGTANPIQYQYIPEEKELIRIDDREQEVIAGDVADVRFIDMSIDPALRIYELKIILTLTKSTPRQRNISVGLSTIVGLRN